MTICSSSCTWCGASVCLSNDTKLTMVCSPSTGWNFSPGTNSTDAIPATSTYRPSAVGVPPPSTLKCSVSLLMSRLLP